MCKKNLFLLIIVFKSILLIGQNERDLYNTKPSVFISPLALVNFPLGSSVRFGIDYPINTKISIGVTQNLFLKKSVYYNDLRANKSELNFRYTLGKENISASWIGSNWIGSDIGVLRTNFTRLGGVYNPLDSTRGMYTAKLTKKAIYIDAGVGGRFMNKRTYFDLGFFIGIRHRDLDVEGLTEKEDDNFEVERTNSEFFNGAMRTTDQFVINFDFVVRFGYCF
jgi:hypothetical protein